MAAQSQVRHQMVQIVQKAWSKPQGVQDRIGEAGVAQVAQGGDVTGAAGG